VVASNFELERIRLAAARELPSGCFEDFSRLSRSLLYGPQFQWLLVDAPHEVLRRQVMAALETVLRAARMTSSSVPLSDRIADVPALEKRLVAHARTSDVVHVVGRPGWFDPARWDSFNVRRERLAAQARARLVFWLDADAIALASSGAPDLWAWRGGVYAFRAAQPYGEVPPAHAITRLAAQPTGPDSRSMAERSRRIAEIRSFLAQHPAPPDDLLAAPLDELGRLLHELGEPDAALAHWRTVELPFHRRRKDERAVAITQGQIADILQARGQLDEALRIRQDEELPVYERLGDVRSKAVTMGKIADTLQARGQLDEALRILQDEVHPVFARLGDVREKAITMGKIADILEARGQLDEALRIRRDDVLPVYERLGDVRSKAVTMGKIADILQARGQLDEALRIRQDEQLPVYERLGDVRSKAIVECKIALQLWDQPLAHRQEAQVLFWRALTALRKMGLPEADQLAQAMEQRGVPLPPG